MSCTRFPPDSPLLTLTREPEPCLWIIDMHNGEDNRLTYNFINCALKPALDAVEREWRETWQASQVDAKSKSTSSSLSGSGLDYANSIKDLGFFPGNFTFDLYLAVHLFILLHSETFNPLLARLLTFPIPVIAAINGHCFAGGFMLALACDYRVMTDGRERRAWCCMNEIHFGAPWPASMAALVRVKISDARTLRRLALEGHRFTPQEALEGGLVDVIAGGGTSDVVLAAARTFASDKVQNAKTGVWGLIKKEFYRHTLEDIAQDYRQIMPLQEQASARARL
ncbi:hypothetical protein EW145_g7571 [Phellinidium pouzarii]|uniref:Enoyl-CoA hydratase n=1 Tax=Phellinidium pouzarii TaxID=167371 RepID=A0A4S4KHA0_9AGAM|nr:hypothetical protein EW145_g7571 [Phellinidium pouzarii]